MYRQPNSAQACPTGSCPRAISFAGEIGLRKRRPGLSRKVFTAWTGEVIRWLALSMRWLSVSLNFTANGRGASSA